MVLRQETTHPFLVGPPRISTADQVFLRRIAGAVT